MSWVTKYFCVGCKKEMSWSTMMGSHGTCPMCGYKDSDAATIVECDEKSARWVRTHKWFWWRGKWEYKDAKG